MKKTTLIFINKIREQLWFRPLFFSILAIAAALLAQQADGTFLNDKVPDIKSKSIQDLLNTISSSMLVIATLAVASMLSAFSNADSIATPRSFKIVITDDVSQNALSIFIGAFIFSIVATVALDNSYYNKAGRFILFLSTLSFFAVVIITFLWWVDSISRLGRLEHIISQVEKVATKSLSVYVKNPLLKGKAISNNISNEIPIFSIKNGYLQYLNMAVLQTYAEEININIRLNCLPGKYVQPNTTIAYISATNNIDIKNITQKINETFHVGHTRAFDDDPRFGLTVLSEIASKALSSGINDPGTAIQIIGSHERLFFLWNKPVEEGEESTVQYDRIEVPTLVIKDLFEDAFRPIARDGANNIEVMQRLQKTFYALDTIDQQEIKEAANEHSYEAFKRFEIATNFKNDIERLKEVSLFNKNA